MSHNTPVTGLSSRVCAVFQVIFRSLKYILVDTITTRYRVGYFSLSSRLHDTFTTSHIVKEQPSHGLVGNSQRQTLRRAPEFLSLTTTQGKWWRMTGSNRRPPACKAGALPAELIPRDNLVGLVGLEPTTPALSRRCSNHLSYRPLAVTANKPISVNA